MTIIVDHAFHIGEQHLRRGIPAQDYTLTGKRTDGIPFAVVSDGCSSGGATDIGARLVALATKRALSEAKTVDARQINAERDLYLETYRRTLHLTSHDMLATSLWAIMDFESLTISVTGDGVFALIFDDHTPPYFYEVCWDKNTPYYPSYRLSGVDEGFKKLHDNPTPLSIVTARTDGIATELTNQNEYHIEPGMQGLTFTFNRETNVFASQIIGAVLFSDGVTQVDNYTTAEVVAGLTSFKSVTGQFFTRRLNRFLQDTKKRGYGPQDDISGAALYDERKQP